MGLHVWVLALHAGHCLCPSMTCRAACTSGSETRVRQMRETVEGGGWSVAGDWPGDANVRRAPVIFLSLLCQGVPGSVGLGLRPARGKWSIGDDDLPPIAIFRHEHTGPPNFENRTCHSTCAG
jgi:hypothetical protein